MESSVLFRFATAFIRRRNPIAPSSPYSHSIILPQGLWAAEDSNLWRILLNSQFSPHTCFLSLPSHVYVMGRLLSCYSDG